MKEIIFSYPNGMLKLKWQQILFGAGQKKAWQYGTTAIPSHGYQAGWSQNLAKRTVTAIKKWREGTEDPKHVKYRQNQISNDSYAATALLASSKKDGENEDERWWKWRWIRKRRIWRIYAIKI